MRAGLVATLIALGLLLRASALLGTEFWVDEAESSLNGLTILEHGYPADHYMDLPLYENTLIEPWPDHAEYEFRDSSYRPRGLAVYHGWLPLYSIAAAQALFGLRPDSAPTMPHVRHVGAATLKRVLVARLPSLAFSFGFLFFIYRLGQEAAGAPVAFAALTWAALSDRAVLFGYAARYYSATLCVSAFAAWMLWRAMRRGRWSDFLLLGFAAGLLFHTHQLSAFVFACVMVGAGLVFRRQPGWLPKCAAACGLAVVLVLPWALATGFFTTAATVPKVVQLFDGPADWLRFVVQRPWSLLVFGAVLALVGLAPTRWLRATPRLAEPLQRIGLLAAVLIAWLALSHLAIHLIVPAASFFPNRLSLTMQVPGIVLVGCVLGVAAQALHRRGGSLVAVVLTVLLLVVSGKLAEWKGLGLPPDGFGLPAASVLRERSFPPDTRLYASPNDQLLYQYLHGLPVQSVAPIRRSFFENYPGPIVFLETRYVVVPDLDERILAAAQEVGRAPDAEEIAVWRRALWQQHAAAELGRRGLPVPSVPEAPEFLAPVQAHLRAAELSYLAASRRRMPLFREVEVDRPGDLWLSFAYRFVGYESRIGTHANVYSRLQQADVELLPEASLILFQSPAPADRHDAGAARPASGSPPR